MFYKNSGVVLAQRYLTGILPQKMNPLLVIVPCLMHCLNPELLFNNSVNGY